MCMCVCVCVCTHSVGQLYLTLCNPMDCSPPGSSIHEDSPGKTTGMGCHTLLQGIFSTQGSNPGLLHCRQILYHLSHQGSPWILEWVAYPFSGESSWPRNWTGVSCFIGGFFTSWVIREALLSHIIIHILMRSLVTMDSHSLLLCRLKTFSPSWSFLSHFVYFITYKSPF